MRIWFLGIGGALAACGGDSRGNCEFEVDGVAVCVPTTGMGFCRDLEGTPYKANSSEDPTCEDLGFPVECPGWIELIGDDFVAEHPFLAATEGDCATAGGATIRVADRPSTRLIDGLSARDLQHHRHAPENCTPSNTRLGDRRVL
jgi:hypothetical protein